MHSKLSMLVISLLIIQAAEGMQEQSNTSHDELSNFMIDISSKQADHSINGYFGIE